ncbi:MAG: hypothetical protein JNM56_20415 [Planctomycetia bacterium]|nr:hypothetical protein [Planctomycetia bacterium]
MTQRRWLPIASLVLFLSAIGSWIGAWCMNARSDRVVRQWLAPEDVQYGSYDPYALSVVEGALDWNLPRLRRRHYLFIGRGTEAPSYGHYLDYTFHPGGKDIDTHIGRSTVEWTPDGVTFVEATGHRLFVPKAMFIGGR